MMKTILKYAGLVVLVVLAIAYILPGSVHVKRTTVIDAAPGEVFALVNSFENFNRWSPWYERDPDGDYRIEGPEQGVGARMTWASDKPDVG
ncbi:MAG: SRPBCC family protein, partial [Pseudomonadota bacterium]